MQFYKPTIRREDMQSVLMAMADEAVGPGKRVEEFRTAFAKFLGFSEIECLRSFPAAVASAMRILGIKAGDCVLVSCFAPLLYAKILENLGINTLVCDVDLQTGVMVLPPDVPDNAKAVLVNDCYQRFPDFEQFAVKGLKVIADLTDAVGSSFDRDGIDIALVSLEDDKLISSAGGACILSDALELVKPDRSETLSDLNASLSMLQLRSFDFYLNRRREIRDCYLKAVQMSGNAVFSFFSESEKDNAFKFAVSVKNYKEAVNFFTRKKIPVRRSFDGTVYSALEDKEIYKNAGPLWLKTFEIPLYYFLKKTEIEQIEKVLRVLP